jgi:long-chain acyl-CoA synthetase
VIAHTDLLPPVEQHAPEGTRIVEVEVPPEVATSYRLDEVPLTGRHPTLDDLVARHEPVTQPDPVLPLGLIYTSGTTGQAKAIVRQPVAAEHRARLLEIVSRLQLLAPDTRTLEPAPMYHTAPNVRTTFAAALGMDLRIMPRFDAEEFLRLVEQDRIQTVQMVPTMFHRLLALPDDVRRRYDVSSLTGIVHGSAPCPVATTRAMVEWFGPILHEFYASSEGGGWTRRDTAEAFTHPGSVGRPFLDAEIRILDEELRPMPAGETGVVYGRSPAGWPEFTYLGNDEARQAMAGPDGFFTVGDVGHLDDDGYLYLTDRLGDTVNSGGVNIYPAEIEQCLQGLAGVADVAVFGIPDADYGEAVAAHVELVAGSSVTEDDVRRHVRAHLASYKVPRVVVFESSLPREDSGKLFKRRLRAAYWPS